MKRKIIQKHTKRTKDLSLIYKCWIAVVLMLKYILKFQWYQGNFYIKFWEIWIAYLFPKMPFSFSLTYKQTKPKKQTKELKIQLGKKWKKKPRSHKDLSVLLQIKIKVFKYFPLVAILTRLWVSMTGLQSVKTKRSNSAFSRDTKYLTESRIYRILFSFSPVSSFASPFVLC